MIYRITKWQSLFESKASERYINKTQCYIPLKQGLGLRRLMAMEDGPAMYGCFIAMAQMCSRHPPPRSGWLTTNGSPDGKPYDAPDIAVLTFVNVRIVEKTLEACLSLSVGWIVGYDESKVPLDCQSTDSRAAIDLPFPSPLHSHLPLPPPSKGGCLKDEGSKTKEMWLLNQQLAHLKKQKESLWSQHRFEYTDKRKGDAWNLYTRISGRLKDVETSITSMCLSKKEKK